MVRVRVRARVKCFVENSLREAGQEFLYNLRTGEKLPKIFDLLEDLSAVDKPKKPTVKPKADEN